jgi:nitrate/nitrite transporter NarK
LKAFLYFIYQEGITESDHLDLLIEQVKMLAGEIAFGTSSLKRLIEQSIEDPEGTKNQVGFLSIFLAISILILLLNIQSCSTESAVFINGTLLSIAGHKINILRNSKCCGNSQLIYLELGICSDQ